MSETRETQVFRAPRTHPSRVVLMQTKVLARCWLVLVARSAIAPAPVINLIYFPARYKKVDSNEPLHNLSCRLYLPSLSLLNNVTFEPS